MLFRSRGGQGKLPAVGRAACPRPGKLGDFVSERATMYIMSTQIRARQTSCIASARPWGDPFARRVSDLWVCMAGTAPSRGDRSGPSEASIAGCDLKSIPLSQADRGRTAPAALLMLVGHVAWRLCSRAPRRAPAPELPGRRTRGKRPDQFKAFGKGAHRTAQWPRNRLSMRIRRITVAPRLAAVRFMPARPCPPAPLLHNPSTQPRRGVLQAGVCGAPHR